MKSPTLITVVVVAILVTLSGCTWMTPQSAKELQTSMNRVEEVTKAAIPLVESMLAYYPDSNEIRKLSDTLAIVVQEVNNVSLAAQDANFISTDTTAEKIEGLIPMVQALATQHPQLMPLVALMGVLVVLLKKKKPRATGASQ